jgi:hypothetical protein
VRQFAQNFVAGGVDDVFCLAAFAGEEFAVDIQGGSLVHVSFIWIEAFE